METCGRFVKLLVFSSRHYVFVDEIEIYQGPDEFLAKPRSTSPITDFEEFAGERLVTQAVRIRLRNDLEYVRSLVADISEPEKRASLHAQLDEMEKEIPESTVSNVKTLKTIFPLNDLHRRILSVQAAVWRTKFAEETILWQTNRWDPLSPMDVPEPGDVVLDISVMSGEFRSAAFNISNAAETSANLNLRISELPVRTNPPYVTAHEVLFTDTKTGVPVAAALSPLKSEEDRLSIHVEPGMTKQVWLTVYPTDVPAGDYFGKIIIEPCGKEVPFRLRIYPIEFPEQPTLHLGGWDYTDGENRDVTLDNREALILHLRERFVDTPWATNAVMPTGTFDKNGNLVTSPSGETFKDWVERWPGARNYCVFLAVTEEFANFEMGSPEFERALSQWIDWWAQKLPEWGLRQDQLALLLFDEPREPQHDEIIIEYARVISKACGEIVIWEDPILRKPWDVTSELYEACDVISPKMTALIEGGKEVSDFYAERCKGERELWLFSCSGPARLLDPYAYHRMQEWFCWKAGAEGSCFWAFGDSSGASSWNEYLSITGAYTPLFLDSTSVTPGKHMEAIREGVEDYEYLRMLRDEIAAAEEAGKVDAEVIASATRLLETAADRVTTCMTSEKDIRWAKPKDRSVADAVRIEILDALVALRSP